MPPLEALIFDVDGTLAETEALHRKAFNATFADAGLPWRWDDALYRDLLRVTGGKERIAFFARDHVGAPMADGEIAALHRAKTDRYARAVREGGLALRPGLRDAITRAQQAGRTLAIATTTSRANVDALCSACFADGSPFSVIAAGDEVSAKKPAPDVYTLALDRLGRPPEACVAIEDSRIGLLSAKAAGLRCVVSPSRYTDQDDFAEADEVVDELSQSSLLATA